MHRSPLVPLALILLCCAGVATADAPPPPPVPEPDELWQAARDGDVARVRAVLDAGVPVDAKTQFDCTALYFAANRNHIDVMNLLIERGADINVQDNSYGYSAMGMAAWLGHTEAVELLIDAGVPAGAAAGSMFAAIGQGRTETVAAILRKVEVPQAQKDAALAMALGNDAQEIAAVLRTAGGKDPEPEPKADDGEAAATTDTAEANATAKTSEPGTVVAGGDTPTPGTRMRIDSPRPWPEFRGAGRTGIADGQYPPLSFDVEAGRNVAWQVPLEGLGYSSPVIWGDRVFVTTAISASAEQTIEDGGRGWIDAIGEREIDHEWQVRAYDLDDGSPVWSHTVKRGTPISERHWKGSQANPTCATDGKTLVASFGSEGLYAFDLDGKPKWKRDLGELNAGWYIDATFEWGYASSPAIHDGRVFVQVDIHGDSFVAAYALSDGKELWRTERDEIPAWGTPLIYDGEARDELVLNASKAIVGYDPATGKELWRINGNSLITVASPIGQDGVIVATGGYRQPKPIYVLKPGASGDITPGDGDPPAAFHWTTQTDGAYIVTPLLYRGVFYLLRANGVLTAYDPTGGEQLYKQRIRGRYTASPVAADGRIYFTSENGEVTVLAAGREYRELAVSELPASTLATPAISNGTMVFRTVLGLVAAGMPVETEPGQRAPAGAE